MKRPKYLYILGCTHIALSTAPIDDVLDCYECQEPRAIIGVHVYEWRARCRRDCTYTKYCGLSQHLAQQIAFHHQHEALAEYVVNPHAQKEFQRLRDNGLLPQS
jgi:hypothetical protein